MLRTLGFRFHCALYSGDESCHWYWNREGALATEMWTLLGLRLLWGCLPQGRLLGPLLAPPSGPACTSPSTSVISLPCSPWAQLCLGATGRLPVHTVEPVTLLLQTILPRLHGDPHFPPLHTPHGFQSQEVQSQERPGWAPTAPPHASHCLRLASIAEQARQAECPGS